MKQSVSWSATQLRALLKWMIAWKQYYEDPLVDFVELVGEPPHPAEYAYGRMIHRLIENMFDFKKQKIRYQSAESLANTFGARWRRIIYTNKKRKEPIAWRSPKHPWELFQTGKAACEHIYDFYSNRPTPIETEVRFKFSVNNMLFYGRIDEVSRGNNGPIVRDFKGQFEQILPVQAHFDFQLTVYALAVIALAHKTPEFAQCCNLPEPQDSVFWQYLRDTIGCVSLEVFNFDHPNEQLRLIQARRTYEQALAVLDFAETMPEILDYVDYCKRVFSPPVKLDYGIFPEPQAVQLPLMVVPFRRNKIKPRKRHLRLTID